MTDEKPEGPESSEDKNPEEPIVPAESEGAEADASAPEGAGDGDDLFVEDILAAAEAEENDPSAEHLADLKRVTAEYANYRRRTESEREVVRERAVGDAVRVLLPVLDDLDRAQKHGDLDGDGAFPTIAAKLRGAVEKLGVKPFGEVGEVFDPQRHEAIFQQPTPGATETTVLDVVETGYTIGSTLVRVARVVVATPAD
ncbi:nucleotide exchange factor GrpE [Gryllotalpicola protaetiae]|uniref:Protein GrpE n=1 Tax=Gryllotalpicola protaetiae TaxID=2419771 RepID=A0A387BYC9_9MICO|nr:nucleotide exchange factor GrpE [Gryllotalpicola protaetiae]AYG03351.1 nucleotide exchange factor GrpE [Gryllotalpicola protaetiae]